MSKKIPFIGNNIRILRTFYGKSRNDLAELLHLTYNTIYAFERGKRYPCDDYLLRLAEYYNISYETLTTQCITEQNLEEWSRKITVENTEYVFQNIFIHCSSHTAKRNEDFIRAEELYQKLITNEETFMVHMCKSARLRYYKSFKDDKLLEGAVNTLQMLLFEYMSIAFPPDPGINNKFANGELSASDVANWAKKWLENHSEKQERFILETEQIFDECLTALRNNAETLSIAEYYLAIKYVYGMVNNGLGYEDKIKIAIIMLYEFSKLGNKYASRFLELDLFSCLDSDSTKV